MRLGALAQDAVIASHSSLLERTTLFLLRATKFRKDSGPKITGVHSPFRRFLASFITGVNEFGTHLKDDWISICISIALRIRLSPVWGFGQDALPRKLGNDLYLKLSVSMVNLSTIMTTLVFGLFVQASSPLDESVFTKVDFGTSQEEAFKFAEIKHILGPGGKPGAVSVHERQELTNPLVVICSDASCVGPCVSFSITGAPGEECFSADKPADPFKSVFIQDPGDIELLFQVGISTSDGCEDFTEIIPESNTCFAINPEGRSWAILDTGDTF